MSTTTPERVQLKTAGQSLTMLVETAEAVPVGKYPEYAFVGTEQGTRRVVEVRVPKASADRQLGRLELALGEVVGLTLLFSRDENPNDASKPFWGITKVGGGGNGTGGGALPRPAATTQPAAPPAPVAPPSQPNGEKPHGWALYRAITAKVLDELPALYEAAGIPLTADATVAAVATIFIQAERR